MAKNNKTKNNRVLFKLGDFSRKLGQNGKAINWLNALKVFGIVCAIGSVGIGFVYLNRYVQRAVPVSERIGMLELEGVPVWLNKQLKEKIYEASQANGENLKLDENAAETVRRNIEKKVAWLDEVKVQTTNDRFKIKARWRKPIAMVKSGREQFYVDSDMVALDFVPITNIPVVAVTGFGDIDRLPTPGKVISIDDIEAAITILAKLEQMDSTVTPDKPLLFEIARIDVSNYNGRQSNRLPHITLYTTNNIEVIWGAEFGMWQRYLEAPDKEKLAKLYGYYKEAGSLLKSVKYINLRDQQEKILQPIDKY